jgi:TonB family protein
LFATIFAFSTICFGQQDTPAKPTQPQLTVPVRDSHSTHDDLAVLLCPAEFNDSLAGDGIAAHFRDENVKPPMVKRSTIAEFSNEARRKKMQGVIAIGLIVSAQGKPQNLCLMRSIGYGLDAKAAEAVQQYQFDPAIKDGVPVASRIHVEVVFRLY